MLKDFKLTTTDKLIFVLGPMDDSVEQEAFDLQKMLQLPAKYIGVDKIRYVVQEAALGVLNSLADKADDNDATAEHFYNKLRSKNAHNKLFCETGLFFKIFQEGCAVSFQDFFSKENITVYHSLVDPDIVVNDIAVSNALSDDTSISIIVSEDYECAILGSSVISNVYLRVPSMKRKVCVYIIFFALCTFNLCVEKKLL